MQAGWHLPKQGAEPEVKVVAMMLGAFWPPEAAVCLPPDPAGTSILHGQSSDESNRGEENRLNGDRQQAQRTARGQLRWSRWGWR